MRCAVVSHLRVLGLLLVAAAGLGSSDVRALGPAGKANYVGFRGELLSSYFAQPLVAPAGFSAEWGTFQNGFVATSTRLGMTRSDPTSGYALLLGGGPQFHIPIGQHVLLMPGVSLATRISEAGFGFAGFATLGAAYRYESFYVGLEGEAPVFLQAGQGFDFFPPAYSMNLLLGLYF